MERADGGCHPTCPLHQAPPHTRHLLQPSDQSAQASLMTGRAQGPFFHHSFEGCWAAALAQKPWAGLGP